jgi:hypothetical protein
MKRIAAGLRCQVDDSSVEAAELRRGTIALDLEFLNRVHVGKERDLPGFRLQNRDAVKEILVGAWAAAVDARQWRGRRWRHGHAGDQARERDEAQAIQWQIYDLPVIDHVPEPRGFTAK